MIIEVIRDAVYSQNAKVLAILSGLKGPDAIEDNVIDISGKVLKDIWLSAIPIQQRILLNDLVLKTICTGRNKAVVIRKLLMTLDRLLIIAPFHHDFVPQQINKWYEINSQ